MKRRGRMHLTAATAALAVACLSPHLARSAESLPAFGMGLAPTAPEAYAALPGVKRYRSFLPAKVDLSDRFPPPGDQGQQGSCSAWATTYAARSFLMTREAGQAQLPAEAVMSPAFVFNQIRPGPDCLRGAALPAALELLKTKGAVPNAAFPYGDCTLRPTPELAAQAQRFRIADFQAVEHRNEQTGAVNRDWRDPVVIDDIKGALVRGRPVVFGMKIPKDFTIPLMGFKGVYRSSERFNRWSPDSSDAMHAMTLVGYDDTKQAFKLINSWSQRWGDGGFMWIDYGTFKNLVGEAYVVEPRSIAPEAKPAVDPRQTRQAQMARVLDQPVCGRLRLSWQGDRPIIEGFARPEDGAAVRERAAALAPNLEWRVRATPFPACEAEMLLTEGLTKEGVQLGISRPSQPLLTASEVTLAEDDLFSIEVETDASRPYVQVFYIQADGSAVELYRGTPAADADGRRRIRAGGSGASDWKFQVAAPFGDEALVAVASQGPVIADKLGHEATERQFLSRLRTALVAAGGSAERPAATLQRLRTLAKGQAAARRDHSKINLAGGR